MLSCWIRIGDKKLTQETKKFYDTTIEELECPHCKKTLEVGFDYNVIIDSPESMYIEVENAGVVEN